jgi:hypothetical protein
MPEKNAQELTPIGTGVYHLNVKDGCMNKWEYKIIKVHVKREFLSSQFDVKAIEEKLNDLGQQGWELVRMDSFNSRWATAPVLTLKRAL